MTFEEIEELAYIEACELVSPNSPEFDALLERITEELMCEREFVFPAP